jgi:CubicO group peptidase (beta-lactamase class C family)
MTHAPDSDNASARRERIENGLKSDRNNPATSSLAERMEHHRTPGVSVAVIHEGRVEWAAGYGVLEAGGEAPVTPETLFQAGSISKPVAATIALRLADAGRIDLDEDVNRYLKSWQVPANGGWQPRITIRQLLSHTGGLTVHGFPGYAQGDPLPTLVQVLNGEPPANTPAVRADALPGAIHRYSGGGTSIVQQALIDLLGKPFPEIAREWVLDPAGMSDSTYEQPLPENRWPKTATAHPNQAKPLAGRWHTYPEMAAVGLWTTATDLARFALELQRAAAGQPNRLLSERMAAEMMTPPVGESAALGLFMDGEGEERRFGHGGWDEGFVAKLVAYQSQEFGAAILLNSDQGWPLLDEITEAIAREYDWPDRPEPRTPLALDPRLLDAYAGEYEVRPGFRLRISREGDNLRLRLDGQPPLPLLAASETCFYADAVASEVEFARSEDGPAASLTLHQSGQATVAKRT